MEAANECSRDVTVGGMIVVTGAIKVGWHHRDEIRSELSPERFAQLDARYFRHRIPFVGRLERSGQQEVFGHRLWRVLRVDAGRTEKEQLFHPGIVGGPDDVCRDDKVVADEIGRKTAIGVNAPYPRGGKYDRVRFFLKEPLLGLGLPRKIECRSINRQD